MIDETENAGQRGIIQSMWGVMLRDSSKRFHAKAPRLRQPGVWEASSQEVCLVFCRTPRPVPAPAITASASPFVHLAY